jgi:hypothetical protein
MRARAALHEATTAHSHCDVMCDRAYNVIVQSSFNLRKIERARCAYYLDGAKTFVVGVVSGGMRLPLDVVVDNSRSRLAASDARRDDLDNVVDCVGGASGWPRDGDECMPLVAECFVGDAVSGCERWCCSCCRCRHQKQRQHSHKGETSIKSYHGRNSNQIAPKFVEISRRLFVHKYFTHKTTNTHTHTHIHNAHVHRSSSSSPRLRSPSHLHSSLSSSSSSWMSLMMLMLPVEASYQTRRRRRHRSSSMFCGQTSATTL